MGLVMAKEILCLESWTAAGALPRTNFVSQDTHEYEPEDGAAGCQVTWEESAALAVENAALCAELSVFRDRQPPWPPPSMLRPLRLVTPILFPVTQAHQTGTLPIPPRLILRRRDPTPGFRWPCRTVFRLPVGWTLVWIAE